jgi:hypothetical protein
VKQRRRAFQSEEVRAARAAQRAEAAARKEAEEADLKLQQEDPKSSAAWRAGGASRVGAGGGSVRARLLVLRDGGALRVAWPCSGGLCALLTTCVFAPAAVPARTRLNVWHSGAHD